MDKLIGEKLDGLYQIESRIGVGGMANVYKAIDLKTGNTVAVKVLREEFMNDKELVRRFKNESRAISILNHPNIVKVYDVSVTDKIQYIVMEYVDGITLKDYLNKRSGVLTWREAVHFASQILQALKHAHENGVVHRDVKPQNIMLLANGDLKMMDFGIARISRAENQIAAGKTMGSVHYISPEQAKGEPTDAKSDIYSLGVMLYEMLSGKLPFEGGTPVEVAIKQISETPKPLAEITTDVPPALIEITEKAMAKNPLNRYASAQEMLDALQKLKEDPDIRFAYTYMSDESSEAIIEKNMKTKEPVAATKAKQKKEKKEKRRRSFFVPIVLGITIAFCVACAVLCSMILNNSANSLFNETEDIELPDLTNMTKEEVMATDVYSKISVKWEEEYNSSVEAGKVYRMAPHAQRTVKEGQQVTLTVSLGTKYESVPELSTMTQETAENILKEKGFNVLVVQSVDTSVAVGAVIRTDPAAGTTVEADSTVILYVSRAQVATTAFVPDLLNMTVEDARKALTAVKLSLGTEYHMYSDYPAGTICGQTVEAGTEVRLSSRVNVYVSDGPEPTEEPTNDWWWSNPSTPSKPSEPEPSGGDTGGDTGGGTGGGEENPSEGGNEGGNEGGETGGENGGNGGNG